MRNRRISLFVTGLELVLVDLESQIENANDRRSMFCAEPAGASDIQADV